jgi:hypothetical protein
MQHLFYSIKKFNRLSFDWVSRNCRLMCGKHLVWQKRRKICQLFNDDICFLSFILWGVQRHLPSVEDSVVVPLLIPELPVVPGTGNRKWIICSFLYFIFVVYSTLHTR